MMIANFKQSKSLKTFLLLCVFCMLSTSVWAAKVVAVEFVGLNSVSAERAKNRLSLVAGSQFSKRKLSRDIKKLYKSGLFSDIKVNRRSVGGGIKLVYTVQEHAKVGQFRIVGNKKIKTEDLKPVMQIRQGDTLDPARLAQSKQEILRLYEEKGYYLVDIDIEKTTLASGSQSVVFKINENKKVKIKRIQFVGNRAFSDKKLRKKMKTKEKGFLSFLSGSGKFKSEKLDVDLQLLRFFYLDEGYLHVKVDSPSVTLTRNKEAIYISVPIHEGEKYKVGSVRVAGDILTTQEELQQKFVQKAKKTYRKSLEIADMKALEKVYGDQAYAFANIVPNLDIQPETRTVNVTYYVQKGPKIKIDKIIIKGNDVTRDKVIRRELKVVENSYYSQSALELSKTRLMQLGFFEDVNVATPRSANGNNKINLVFNIQERKNTGEFSVGAGFSTLENFFFTASVRKENFFGRGWSGGVFANISKLRQNFSLNMTDRYFLDTRWQFGFSVAKINSSLNQNFDQNRFGGSVRFGRELFDFFNVILGYVVEDVSASNFDSLVPLYFQQNSSGLTSAGLLELSYDRRDNRIFTTKGVYSMVRATWSDDYLGASNKYFLIEADQRVFVPLPAGITLKGRAQFQYINSLSNQPVGLFDRFFLGGPNSLRGFNAATIGPSITLPSTPTSGTSQFVYGGNKSLLFNAELEVPVFRKAGLHIVGFFDAGNAFGETENISFQNLRMNYGAGFRWKSPLGLMRFEWGFPIRRRSGESATVFNFTFGQSF